MKPIENFESKLRQVGNETGLLVPAWAMKAWNLKKGKQYKVILEEVEEV